MASNASNPAANPPRRPVRRIVPAIPLALTRRPPSTRPITPEGTTTAPLASPSTEAKGAGPNGASDHLQDGPPTPQSPAFGIGSSHAEKEEDTPAGTTAAPDSSPDLGMSSLLIKFLSGHSQGRGPLLDGFPSVADPDTFSLSSCR